jgi:hypothetical protein
VTSNHAERRDDIYGVLKHALKFVSDRHFEGQPRRYVGVIVEQPGELARPRPAGSPAPPLVDRHDDRDLTSLAPCFSRDKAFDL